MQNFNLVIKERKQCIQSFAAGIVIGGTAVGLVVMCLVYRQHTSDYLKQKTCAEHAKCFEPSPVGRSPLSIADIKDIARSRMKPHIWKYISYTSGSGLTYKQALPTAFDAFQLIPRILKGATTTTTNVNLFGKSLKSPLLAAPTAFHGLYCRGGEAATAFGTSQAGVGYCYNFGLSNVGADDVNNASIEGHPKKLGVPGIRWAHVYLWKDKQYVLWTLQQAERLNFDAVIVTADHPHDRVKYDTMPIFAPHERERVYDASSAQDQRKQFCQPDYNDMQLGETLEDIMVFQNLERFKCETSSTSKSNHNVQAAVLDSEVEPATVNNTKTAGINDDGLCFADLKWLCTHTSLPVVCKGVLHPQDAIQAVLAGCQGVCVSNHGGRQLDCTQPAISALPGIIKALHANGMGHIPVIVDTGFRTGTQILKALALGASAVMLGRPVLWGLAAGGALGVRYVFERLTMELQCDMKSVGVASIEELRKSSDTKSMSCILHKT